MDLKEKLTEKFLRYVAVNTQSDATNDVVPSTAGQFQLADLLAGELEELGLVDISVDEHAVVYSHLPARLVNPDKKVPAVGWVCHMDTVDVDMSGDIHPLIIKNYQGGDILQNEEKQIYIKESEHPELAAYIGDDIIVSDGTSVLGADNKAAIANIMTALEVLVNDETRQHGEIYVCFVPDEEIGLKGAKSMDFSKFPVDFAYTIDCCGLGEVVWQTFNAGWAVLDIEGVTAHPMSSKNNLVNPTMVAVDFVNLFDRTQMPECTEKTEGYIWPQAVVSNSLNARVSLNIRDHDLQKYEAKKAYIKKAVEMVQLKHPKAKLTLQMGDTYGNIADALTDDNKQCIDYLYEALKQLDIPANTIAMRGGTDGSFISTKGIPTPNYFTGAHNFHSASEFLPLSGFEASCKVTLKLIELISQ